ncbi:MAG: T9SS type A sorting domain-containing protein, partial [Bacteroides sp.]
QGIGGGLGGYNFYQSIFKGIQKPTNTSRPSYLVSQTSSMTTTATTIGKGTQFTVCYGVRNQGINTISPYFGFALYQNDTFVNILNSTSFNEPLKYGYGNDNINLKLTINSSVANGNYQLRPVYRMDKAASWAQMRSVVGIVNYLNVRVTNDNVTISKPDGIEAKISVTNPFEIVGNLYQQKKGRFKVSLKNTSKVEFCAPISIYIQEKSSTKREYSATEGITLQPNETIDMNLTSPLNYTPGDYLIYLVVEGNNETQDLATIEAKILSPPTEPYQLIITQAPTSTKTSIYSGEEMNLTAKIKNEGGYYDGAVGIVYVRVNNENSKKMFKYQDLILDKNEETIITLNDYVELLPSEYNACIYTYDNKKKTWFGLNPIELNKYTFTVIEGSGIDSPNYSELSIYPNPATNKLNVRADDNVKFIRITNLTGKTMITLSPSQEEKEISISIDELNAGTYLLQITTDNGIRTNKFIKQN